MKIATKRNKKSKSIPKLKKELETLLNRFVRARDIGRPCISCGGYGTMQAGHYYPVKGYDGLRFDEFNVNNECQRCNLFDESHLIGYGENLIKKIGIEEYEKLKQRARDYKMNGYKFSRTELLEKIEYYKNKLKGME